VNMDSLIRELEQQREMAFTRAARYAGQIGAMEAELSALRAEVERLRAEEVKRKTAVLPALDRDIVALWDKNAPLAAGGTILRNPAPPASEE
jgi:hypothetical protein